MDCSGLVSGFGFRACGSAFRVGVVLEVVRWQIAHAHETHRIRGQTSCIRSSMRWMDDGLHMRHNISHVGPT